jgi:hypothetical protein
MRKTPDAVADPPSAPPALECDEIALKNLESAYAILDACVAELEKCQRAQANLSKEVNRLAARVRDLKQSRLAELIELFSKSASVECPDDPAAGDSLRLAIASGTLEHLAQHFLPARQRAATAAQVAILRCQSSICRSIASYRKVRLAEALAPVASLEGTVEINSATLKTTAVIRLGDELEVAAQALQRRNQQFEEQAAKGEPRCGFFDSALPSQQQFRELFFYTKE